VSALQNQSSISQRPVYQSNIRLCDEEPPYWLSLYQGKGLYSTTGQCSYMDARKHALLWISIKNADRGYRILHEKDGFQIEETMHLITQKCQHEGCRFASSHSSYIVDADTLQSERLNHLARHNRTGKRNFKFIFICMLLVLFTTIFGIFKGWF
jgi:hypothetical protein